MPSPSPSSTTWVVDQRQHRSSFASRVSSVFFGRQPAASSRAEERATATFEVPLFLSPTRYEPPQQVQDDTPLTTRRSRASTRSVIDAAASVVNRIRPLSLPSSSRYSSPACSPRTTRAPELLHEVPSQISSQLSTGSEISRTRGSGKSTVRHRRRRRTSTRNRIRSLKHLSISFGVTLLLSLVTYLVLAMTGAASGIMFHVLTVLLLLVLAGVLLITTVKLCRLIRRRDEKLSKQNERRWWAQQDATNAESGQWTHTQPDPMDDLSVEKPIQIIMAEDEVIGEDLERAPVGVRQPPPVYGNFRDSKRINPNLVHWRNVPPSPLTPTYAEAMYDVQRSVGYRPPSYVASESGTTQIIETQRRDVDNALRHVHPLERERIAALTGQPF